MPRGTPARTAVGMAAATARRASKRANYWMTLAMVAIIALAVCATCAAAALGLHSL